MKVLKVKRRRRPRQWPEEAEAWSYVCFTGPANSYEPSMWTTVDLFNDTTALLALGNLKNLIGVY